MVLHRRAGKSFVCIQDLLAKALTHKRKGPPLRYAYLAPTRDQAKDIAFGYLVEFSSQIPGAVINKADLSVTFHNGASIRLYSGDAYERLRGIYLDGIVLDEAADIDPAAWDNVIRPTLSDYHGWATWVGTPKGRDGFYRTYVRSTQDPGWFSLLLKASQSGIIPLKELEDLRRGTSEKAFRQEFECDFNVGRPGAIYSQAISDALSGGRVSENVQWFKQLPVYTSFDIGAPQNQKCWIWQMIGDRINFLESLSGGEGCKTPADWAHVLRGKQYSYGAHFLPHDAAIENGGQWQTALQTAGLSHVVCVPRQFSVWDGINSALDNLPRCSFHASQCADGIEALEEYHAKQENDGVSIRDVPVHDWSSHFSDAFSLAHQAMGAGLVVDRTAIPRRPLHGGGKPRVLTGFRG